MFGWPRYRLFAVGEDTLVRRRRLASALAEPVASFATALVGAVALGAIVTALGGAMPSEGVGWLVTSQPVQLHPRQCVHDEPSPVAGPAFRHGAGAQRVAPGPAAPEAAPGGAVVVLAVIATGVAIPLLDPHARIGGWVAAPMINAITRFVLGLVNLTV